MSAQTHHSRREANFGGSNYGMGRTEQRYLLDHRAFQALASTFEVTMKDLNLARQRQGCGVPRLAGGSGRLPDSHGPLQRLACLGARS